MSKWEYLVVRNDSNEFTDYTRDATKLLNRHAQEGWELFEIGGDGALFYFKRELPRSPIY